MYTYSMIGPNVRLNIENSLQISSFFHFILFSFIWIGSTGSEFRGEKIVFGHLFYIEIARV